VVDENDPTMKMQQLLKAMGQTDTSEVKPILEINPDHELVKRLKTTEDESYVEDMSVLLLDQALLVENVPIKEPAEFVRRMNRVLERA
jgi:molecular chaperone HtpG